MRIVVIAISLITLLLGACSETTDSDNVTNEGIYAQYDIVSNGTNTTLTAALKVAGPSSDAYLELDGGDQLSATNGIKSLVLTKDEGAFGDVHYRAVFDDTLGDLEYTVYFDRPKFDSTIASSVMMPAAFEIDRQSLQTRYTSDENMIIGWTPASNESMHIGVGGDCAYGSFSAPRNTDRVQLNLNELNHLGSSRPDTCTITVTLTRSVNEPVNAEFGEGGRFNAEQVRRFAVEFEYVGLSTGIRR